MAEVLGRADAAALDDLAGALAGAGVVVERDRPIGPLSTYRVGGAASVFVEPADEDALTTLASVTARHPRVPTLVVGAGSNMLVADSGFAGLAVHLGAGFDTVERRPDEHGAPVVRAGAAALLPRVARRTAAWGLRGFEWAVGVPGSIGGAVRMNAGGHGSDMAASLLRVRRCDLRTGETVTVTAGDLDLGYRSSNVAPTGVVAWADLRLVEGDALAARAELDSIVRWRREHQPGGQNAGSVFTNPDGDSAGRLIDTAGAKGLRVGTAEVSTKHANFIQADPGGSADDVFAVMVAAAHRVEDTVGVRLHPETVLVGFGPWAEAVAR